MTTADHIFAVQYLEQKCEHCGFTIKTECSRIIVTAKTARWKRYNDQAKWSFITVEEAIAFLEGFMARGAYMDEERRVEEKNANSRKGKKGRA